MEQEHVLALRVAPDRISKSASVAELELRINHGQVRLRHDSTIFQAQGRTQGTDETHEHCPPNAF
jgi:hypothetical protein